MRAGLFKYASPVTFAPLAGRAVPWFATAAILAAGFGLYWGFFETPDRLGGSNPQKEYYRIIFVHVPSAWMSMWLYVVLAGWSAVGLVFNTRLSFMLAASVAPTGALFTFAALWTGAIWGRTSWGTWWDWDPRLTSELVLFFLYTGYIALRGAMDDQARADRACAVLALVGVVCVPVIFWSINCPDPNQCAALHQRSSLSDVHSDIIYAMLALTFAGWMYAFATSFARVRTIILERESNPERIPGLTGRSA